MPVGERPASFDAGYSGNRQGDDTQDGLKEVISLLRSCPFIQGVELPRDDEVGQPNVVRLEDGRLAYELGAGASAVFSHRLGRVPRGLWAVANFGWSPAVQELFDAAVDRSLKMKLQNNAGVSHQFRLWVF